MPYPPRQSFMVLNLVQNLFETKRNRKPSHTVISLFLLASFQDHHVIGPLWFIKEILFVAFLLGDHHVFRRSPLSLTVVATSSARLVILVNLTRRIGIKPLGITLKFFNDSEFLWEKEILYENSMLFSSFSALC